MNDADIEKIRALPPSEFHRAVDEILRQPATAPKKHSSGLPKRKSQYRRAIITFIDVLGFKKLVQERGCAEVHHLLDQFRAELAPDMFDVQELSLHFVRFSDCLARVIFIPDDKPNGPDGLVFWELLGLLLGQMNLIWRGVVVRGAVTIGNVYCAPGTIFGPGFVRAYELERAASHPRIVVDPDLLHTILKTPFRSRQNTPKQEIEAIQELISEDGNHIFLDYFKGIDGNRDSDKQMFEFVLRHRDLVRKGLSENKAQPRIVRKYRWMALRHRAFVAAIPDAFVHGNGFKKKDLHI